MVEQFSYLTYVHLMRDKSHEEYLAVKPSLERPVATFGIKVNRYHSDNGIFSEQPFRTEIEDSNQTIKHFGLDLIIKMPFLKEK